jgi:short-chain fatty acids transporter
LVGHGALAAGQSADWRIVIQFPLYGGIAAMMTAAKGFGGESVADQLAHVFANLTAASTFPVVMGVYSAVLGFFVPSGGGNGSSRRRM